jgi:hypothetical protein
LLDGLYKVEYGIEDAFGRSVMCMHAGKLLGGNSAFAHLGSYQDNNGEITAEIITQRHNNDPYYKPLMGADVAAINVRGRANGSTLRFEGSAAPMPGALFWADLTRLDDEALPPAGAVGQGGLVNGLYSIHIRALDGIEGGLTGVMLLIDGRILGGDAFFISAPTPPRTAAGRARSSIRNIPRQKARTPCSAAMRSASVSPAPATNTAQNSKRSHWPASAAFD